MLARTFLRRSIRVSQNVSLSHSLITFRACVCVRTRLGSFEEASEAVLYIMRFHICFIITHLYTQTNLFCFFFILCVGVKVKKFKNIDEERCRHV